jgi:Flp pilus assembly protein TadD
MKKKKLPHPATPAAQASGCLESTPLQVVALVLIVWVAFWNSLGGGFHFDDQGIFLDSFVMSSGFGWKIMRLMQTRPLTYFTFHWNYLAGGAAPLGFHAINVLLHTMNTILVMRIAGRHLRAPMAFLAAALFAVHPLQTQAVNYVFERATLLAAFFALLSLLLFMQQRFAWAATAFGLSLLAKEETVALPAFLLLYDFVYQRRLRWGSYAAMCALAALAAARLSYVLQKTPEAKLGFGKGIPTVPYALTQCRVIWIYARLILLPSGLNLDHEIDLSRSLFSPAATFPALLLLVLSIGVLAWFAARRSQPALWGLGFLVLLVPSSSVIPAIDLMFEHRTYFPLACLTIAAACLLDRWQSRFRTPVLVALLAALLAGTIARNRVWHDDRSLWADVVEKSPGKSRGYFQLGQAFAAQEPIRARQLYERGLAIEPGNPSGQTNLGLILMSENDLDGALVHLRLALKSGENNPTAWNNIGAAEVRRGRLEEAIQAFRRALEIDPCRFDARLNLMRILASVEGNDEARVAGAVEASCNLLPEQAKQLDRERSSLR